MLKRIEVKNFKSLKHIDFKCAGLNLLMGMNGAGKSSFVQLLMFLRSIAKDASQLSVAKPLSACGNDVGKFEDLKYCYAKEEDQISFAAEFEAGEMSANTIAVGMNDGSVVAGRICRVISKGHYRGEILIENPELLKANADYSAAFDPWRSAGGLGFPVYKDDDEKAKIEAVHKKAQEKYEACTREAREREEKVDAAYSSLWENAKFVSSFRERPHTVHNGASENERLWGVQRIGFDPEGGDVVEFLYHFGNVLTLQDPNWGFVSRMIHPESVRKGDDGNENVPMILNEQVRYWLHEISPGAEIYIDKIDISDDEKFVLSVGYGEGERCPPKKFKPQNVGFGISYVLPVIVTLLTSHSEDVVVIENPEAHLHPKGQAKMGELIARAVASDVQVFVETHSDHVVNGIRSAVKDGIVSPKDVNIAFFERKEHDVPSVDGTAHQEIYSEVRNIRVDKNGSLSEYPDGFMDEWNNQLMELI